MKFLAVLSNNVNLKKEGQRLVLETPTNKVKVLLRNVYGILIFGRTSLSSEAVNFLLREEKPVFFLTKFGKLKGVLLPEFIASNNNNRLEQYFLYTERRVETATFFVQRKLEEIERTFGVDLTVEKSALENVKTVEELLGVEGTASKKMFDAVKELLKNGPLPFGGRSYRPPADETNALLSLTYTMVYLTAYPVVVAMGYDPYLSFLHTKRGAHAAFCSDLMEPVRPYITQRLVLEIKRGLFSKRDFQSEGNKGFYLTNEALDKFLNFYERELPSVLDMLRETLSEFSTLTVPF